MQDYIEENKTATTSMRFWAFLIDLLIIIVVDIILQKCLPLPSTIDLHKNHLMHTFPIPYYMMLKYLFVLAFYVLYYIGFLVSDWQATIGKRIIGLYIAKYPSNKKANILQLLARIAISQTPLLFFIIILLFGSYVEYKAEDNTSAGIGMIMGMFMIADIVFGLIYYALQAISINSSANNRGFPDTMCKTVILKGRI